jgi:tetratricopeptide (TPR) repeat protein
MLETLAAREGRASCLSLCRFWFCLLALCLGPLGGCARTERAAEGERTNIDVSDEGVGEEVFSYVFDVLQQYPRIEAADAPVQALEQLNQWISSERRRSKWRRDPLVDELLRRRPELARLSAVRQLSALSFPAEDAYFLQHTVWMRDVAKNATSGSHGALGQCRRLFDWVVRNVQLEPESRPGRPPFTAGEVLLLGRGTVWERAWLFILLARQLGHDVVVLAAAAEGKPPEPFAVALVDPAGLYVFEPRLGLEIPGPGGQGVATLAQLAADDALLRNLDLSAEERYPLTSDMLSTVVPLIEASPPFVSRRMQLVQEKLAAHRYMVVAVSPSNLAQRLARLPGIAPAQLWELPYDQLRRDLPVDDAALQEKQFLLQALQLQFPDTRLDKGNVVTRRALWRGRMLQFAGAYSGEEGAARYLQLVRINDPALARAAGLREPNPVVLSMAQQDAAFWLGHTAYARKSFDTAAGYFDRYCLQADPDGIWASAARYNLARAYEAAGNLEDAIATYRSGEEAAENLPEGMEPPPWPQRHGDLLRARWLESGWKPE